MYFLRRNPDFRTLSAFLRFYSFIGKTHYEVLNLRRNCTDKEIKEAFIQMSKEYHPDKNKDERAQEHFVRIVEAYNILGKPGSRAQYDCTTEYVATSSPYVYRNYDPYRYNPYDTRHTDKKSKSDETRQNSKAYYGKSGVRRVPNYIIIMICFGITFVGTILQVFVIKELYVVHRRQAFERSMQLSAELDKVRARAQENDNEMQTRILLERIVAAANPTVATASLGQALANEKK